MILTEIAKQYLHVREGKVNNIAKEIQLFQTATWLTPGGWAWCFDEDVEALTNKGWVKLKNLRGDELVATANPDGSFYYDKIISIIRNSEAKQDVAVVKNRNIEFICTSNHRFGGYWNSKHFAIKPISEIKTILSIPIARGTKYNSNYTDSDIKFIAAFICDGFFHKRYINFQVSKERKIKALKEFNVRHIYTAKKTYGLSKIPLTTISFTIPDLFDNVFTEYKVLNQNFIKSLSSRQAKLFIDTYNFYDGTTNQKGRKTISTSRENSIDELTQIATIAGLKYSISKRFAGLKKTKMWSMAFNNTVKKVGIKKGDIIFTEKTIPTYCIETKTGLFVMRDKNKNSIITGNCSAFMCWVLKEALTNQSYHSYIKSRYKGAEDPEKWRCRDASAFGWQKWAEKLQPLHKDKIVFDEKEVAKQDDLVIYDFSHIGVVIENQMQLGFNLHTIEGNTQPKTAQRDGTGDGVYEMYRKPNLVKNYIRL